LRKNAVYHPARYRRYWKNSEIILPDLIPLLTKINQIMLSRKPQNTHTAKDTTASM
jgi:hypothetical protein